MSDLSERFGGRVRLRRRAVPVVSTTRRFLCSTTSTVDTLGMDRFANERLAEDQSWRTLLEAYARAANAGDPDESGDGWTPRIDALPDVEDDRLPRLHGRLIAFGLIKFELSSPAKGVVYKITPKGRSQLLRTPASGAETVEGSRPAA